MKKLKEISKELGMRYCGDGDLLVSSPAEPSLASETELAIATDKKFFEVVKASKAKVALLIDGTDWEELGLQGALFVSGSRFGLAKITNYFSEPTHLKGGIHPTAIISKSAIIGKHVYVGPFSVIADGAILGDFCSILSHAYVGKHAELGAQSFLHSGVRLGTNVKIGKRFICHPNTVIGCDGFSFTSLSENIKSPNVGTDTSNEISQKPFHIRIASLGSVTIGDDVEIGASSTIDKGTLKNTRIGAGSKIDNLVHIGHNVTIGEDCLLCGQVGIAGSATIGDRVILGGQVGVADHISIGNFSIIAGKSGVSSNVPKGQFMMGNPAMRIENNIASYKAIRRLPRLVNQIKELQRIILS